MAAPEQIEAQLGKTAGARLSQILGAAPRQVFDLIDRHGIACEPQRTGTLHCAHAPVGMQDLRTRHAQLVAIGAPVQLIDREETCARTGSPGLHGALFDPRAGTVQPYAYARGLARAAAGLGARLFEDSPALTAHHDGGLWHVSTPQGRVQAKALIQATDAYPRQVQGVARPAMVPVHYFQAATAPLSPDQLAQILPGREGCWDTAMAMSSWRLDQGGRLILGAMGNPDQPAGAIHTAWLARKLARLFPSLAGVPLGPVWKGRIGMTTEHLPKILSAGPSALMAFGYSGRGIGPGTVFGAAMARSLLGGTREDLPVPVSPGHALPFAGLRGVYYETGATLLHLAGARR